MKGKHRTKKGGNQDFLEKNAGGGNNLGGH